MADGPQRASIDRILISPIGIIGAFNSSTSSPERYFLLKITPDCSSSFVFVGTFTIHYADGPYNTQQVGYAADNRHS